MEEKVPFQPAGLGPGKQDGGDKSIFGSFQICRRKFPSATGFVIKQGWGTLLQQY